MTVCKLCEEGDPSINVRCHNCRVTFHLHRCQLDMVPEDCIVMGDCPSCGAVNCWQKQEGKINYSGPVIYSGQTIRDVRGKL